jgi:cytidyltransferase-like protein
MKKVMAFGTFDLLHEGHKNYFKQAKEHGDFLVVAISRDSNAQKYGKHLMNKEHQRMLDVYDCELVDEAMLGCECEDLFQILLNEKPDVICLGYDQIIQEVDIEKYLEEHDLKAKVLRMKPYKPEIYKSTLLKEQMK